MKIIKLTIILLVLTFSNTYAQDPFFTQSFQTPILVSPTLAGVSDNDARIQIVSRNQWSSILKEQSFKTFYASYDQRKLVGRNDFFGFGGMAWGDRAGQSQLTTSSISGAFSYGKNIYKRGQEVGYLVAGALVGFTNRRLNSASLTWANQYDGRDGIDPTFSSGENITNPQIGFLETGVGLQYYHVSKTTSIIGGVSYYHFNKPSASFLNDNKVEVKPRMNFFVAGQWKPQRRHVALLGNILVQTQNEFFQTQMNTSARHYFGVEDREFFEGGLGVRVAKDFEGLSVNALLFNLGYQFGQFRLGLSYDLTLSNLKNAATSVGTYELSLGYSIDLGLSRKVVCPRF